MAQMLAIALQLGEATPALSESTEIPARLAEWDDFLQD